MPPYARVLRRLASFSHLICLDPYRLGFSDSPSSPPDQSSFGQYATVVLDVLDAVGSERAARPSPRLGGNRLLREEKGSRRRVGERDPIQGQKD